MDSCLVLTSMIRNHLEKPAGSSHRVKKRAPDTAGARIALVLSGRTADTRCAPWDFPSLAYRTLCKTRSALVSQLWATICWTGLASLGCTRCAGIAHPITTARVTRIPDRRMELEVPFPDEMRDPVRDRRVRIRRAVDLDLIRVRALRTGLCQAEWMQSRLHRVGH